MNQGFKPSANVGINATLHTNELKVSVKIIDAKIAYGAIWYLVLPVSGSGQVWASADRVSAIGSTASV